MTITVEFAGLPGSGKTMLEAELVSGLRDSGISIFMHQQAPKRIRRKTRALWWTKDVLPIAIMALLRDSRRIPHRVRALRWLMTSLQIHYEARSETSDAVAILGEGLVQRSILLFIDVEGLRINGRFRAYVSAIPKPDVIIYLRIDPVTSVKRQQTRRQAAGNTGTGSRVADRFDLTPDRLLRAMELADELLSQVIGQLATDYGVEVLTLDASDLSAAKKAVRSQPIRTIIRSREPDQP